MKKKSRLNFWLAQSIAHRIRFYALMLTTIIIILFGVASYWTLRITIFENVEQKLNSEVTQVARVFSLLLDSITKDVEALTQNSFVANGLVDSTGKEVYLIPFLRDHKNSSNIHMNIVMVDFQGIAIAANSPEHLYNYRLTPEVTAALEQEKYTASVITNNVGDFELLLVSPVIFPPTKHMEGALVVKVSLNELFQEGMEWISPNFHAELSVAEMALICHSVVINESDFIQNQKTITLKAPFPAFTFNLKVAQKKTVAFAYLHHLTLILSVITPFIWLLVFFITGRMANRLVHPIKKLNETVALITESGELDVEIKIESQDEVGQLTASFKHMFNQLHTSYSTLEEKVIERTQELQESEQRLQEIINVMPITVFIKDTSSHILMMNKACEAQWGASLSQLQGSVGETVFSPAQLQFFLRQDQAIFTRQHLYEFDNEAWHAALQQKRAFHTYKKPVVDKNGKALYLIGISIDVTDSKLQEENLRLAKIEAERANQAKSSFLANMSHEIRTPMNAIINLVKLSLNEKNTEKQHYYLEQVENSSELLLNIINDILDFSKIEAGKLTIDNSPFNLIQLLESLKNIFILKASEKDVELIFIQDERLPTFLLGDELRLKQILINLTNNAIKFTDRGKITVSVQVIAISDSGYALLKFSVTDTGIGISKKKLPELFRPFVQAENSTTRKFGGSGLGLSISSSLVHLLGGKLEAKSEFGQGSCFYFQVPFKIHHEQNAVQKNSHSTTSNNNLVGKKVLIVEDNKTNRLILRVILEQKQIKFDEAENGLQALELIECNHYDAVLMDIQMPVMDGLIATGKIRSSNKHYKNIPIIAMTAYAFSEDRERFLEAGMSAYVSKPINTEEFLSVLNQQLS